MSTTLEDWPLTKVIVPVSATSSSNGARIR
jgi:hypothetical protein